MNLLIIGAPGAGKGTMSDLILKNYDIVHVSTGDMLREAVKNKTEIGLKAQEYMNAGQLVPDEIINGIIVERLSKDDINKGFLFDGYPRNVAQAESLSKILESLNKKIDAVINLDVKDEVLIKRITGRRLCPKCGAIYNVYYSAPKEENKCDKCGADLNTRKDDNEESLKVRLQEFHHNTQPVIEYYDKANIVNTIDADKDINLVFEDVKKALEGIK